MSAISPQNIQIRTNLKNMKNINIEKIKSEYNMWLNSGLCNERSKRLWVGIKANIIGYGGCKILKQITGLSKSTIIKGKKEALIDSKLNYHQIRKLTEIK